MSDRLEDLHTAFIRLHDEHRQIDMMRGNPSPEQIALSRPMLAITDTVIDGIDCANYGGLQLLSGLPQARQLFAEYLGVSASEVIVQGNSSLALMHDIIAHARISGIGRGRWDNVKFICPTPGYDRHFAICEDFGIHMLPVPLYEHGPDMRAVE